ncbi:MarR family winged helix-turn-helix transcriptional regulator [Arthrobacter sp. M4]|uniref:MarR family winged helix-turn-helix transcriptional regulator n=1 Tax=Arthrobacter sp. M4 TaxID=218160 RepID=UPI001CDD72E0|nr:MarR family transcriptional regulator [Arthrobacter sp. M4]MCA4132454.1 MarR family transcriptional regulator [Arthrobacter sp. M4]
MPDKGRPARIGFLLSQLGAHAVELFATQTRALGVTPSEAGVIRIIGRSPGISQRELAELLGSVQSRVVALIDRLEGAGLVTRTRSAADRRVQELRLTPSGNDVLGSLRHAAEAQEAAIVDGLTREQTEELLALLSKLSSLRGLDADVHVGYRDAAHHDPAR